VFDWFGLLVGVALVVALGTWAADAHEGETGDHDASEVVIDEVAGQWIALLPVAHLDTMPWWTWLIAFALFRLFDIWKPGPIGRLDRSFEGGAGTMADDVAAGLLAALVLALLSPLLTP
jgi:phosphatidylglycerophosphatase A